MTVWSDSGFLLSLAITIVGVPVMSWWLLTRISLKLREVEERKNRASRTEPDSGNE
ncbi:MAG TPA: hypothetical protein QF641_02925 [Candidatus Thalassarchaeaceae archaeon]|nr:hypothetical protein [Candidatus Thalassarchaeaceae archaeon]